GLQVTDVCSSPTEMLALPPKPLNASTKNWLTAERKAGVPTTREPGGKSEASNLAVTIVNVCGSMTSGCFDPRIPTAQSKLIGPDVDQLHVLARIVRDVAPEVKKLAAGRQSA